MESLSDVWTSDMSLLVERMFVSRGTDEDFREEITSSSAAFVILLQETGVRSGLLSRRASLSTMIVQSEFAFSLFSETPEKKSETKEKPKVEAKKPKKEEKSGKKTEGKTKTKSGAKSKKK